MNEGSYDMRVIELSGDYYDVGRQHGLILKEDIRNMIEKTYIIFKFYVGLDKDACLKKSRKFLEYVKELAPELYEEILGISEGAEVLPEEILMLNLHARNLSGGCTAFFYKKSDREVIIGQTIDWVQMLKPHWVLLKLNIKGGKKIVMLTKAGIIGHVGKNSDNVHLLMNILLTDETVKRGLPAHLLMRKALEQDTLGKALNVLISEELSSEPFNYIVMGPDGDAYNVEKIVSGCDILNIDHILFVHTNHILSERLREHDKYVEATKSTESIIRYNRMKKLLSSKKKFDIESLSTILSDHYNYPESICRHPDPSSPEEGKMATLCAIMFSTRYPNHTWVCYGNPCKVGFKKYQLW